MNGLSEEIAELIIKRGVEFIYSGQKAFAAVASKIEKKFSSVHFEITTNEKIAFELAISASILKKRSAFLTNSHSVFEALDPLMSSTYMGVLGGMLIVVLRETYHDVSFLGPFAKLPIIVEGNETKFQDAISFGIYVSEKFEIPVLVELDLLNQKKRIDFEKINWEEGHKEAQFVKDIPRWAATPSFRYVLHLKLNEKIKKIREEFESYGGNVCEIKSKTGFVAYREGDLEFIKDEFSYLLLSTVYPLPNRFVSIFMENVEEVHIVSDPYSIIEFQLDSFKEKIRRSSINGAYSSRITKKEEFLYGYRVIRDTIGPSSSLNMAHGIKKLNPQEKILALTYEDNFFHSGLPAFINTLYNDSDYHLAILTKDRENEIIAFFEALHFHNYHIIRDLDELKLLKDQKGLTVFLVRKSI